MAFEYKKLLSDYNREVRRATHDTMILLVAAVGRDLAPHLKSLMGPWWVSQFDPASDVSQAAKRSFQAAFPAQEKRLDALILCTTENIYVFGRKSESHSTDCSPLGIFVLHFSYEKGDDCEGDEGESQSWWRGVQACNLVSLCSGWNKFGLLACFVKNKSQIAFMGFHRGWGGWGSYCYWGSGKEGRGSYNNCSVGELVSAWAEAYMEVDLSACEEVVSFLKRGLVGSLVGWENSLSEPMELQMLVWQNYKGNLQATGGYKGSVDETIEAVDPLAKDGGDFGKIEPGGYFEFRRSWFETFKNILRRGIGGHSESPSRIPDETLLRWRGEGKGSVYESPIWDVRLSSDSGSDSILDSELPPELRSELCRPEVKPWPRRQRRRRRPSIPPKGSLLARNVRGKGDPVIEIGEPDSSKGKETVPPPPPKRFKSNRGAINARGRAAEAGTSSPAGDRGSESMSDASVARRLLTEVIPASDKKEVDQISENDLVAKSFTPWVVVFASSLASAARSISTIRLSHGSRGFCRLELATVAELTSKLAKAKELAIEDFKSLGGIQGSGYGFRCNILGDGFEFCKRQLLHQFPTSVPTWRIWQWTQFWRGGEATKEGGDHVAGLHLITNGDHR
ncbi:HEAT/U-box domain-containing protein [Actinidia rufa]|uniref:E3 ubiquitin-protein ligase listerin n=1 Tax=Actinidia rufa TaxID=165716 RepID=A0A7J0HA44_9ERIC|nr:HEAT/U-box domain-containing protein [Actinidia rufa]